MASFFIGLVGPTENCGANIPLVPGSLAGSYFQCWSMDAMEVQ